MDEEYNVYLSSGGMVAVKWAAPESLSSFQYSSASDVWSFAVTMFEIWSLGYKPYHELTNTQVSVCVTMRWIYSQRKTIACKRPLKTFLKLRL